MYLVTIFNDDEAIIINNISTEYGSNRIECNFKLGINTIDSCTFVITPDNVGFNKINPLKTTLEIFNIITNKIEFKGRVLLEIPSMDNTGLFKKQIICESELGYLLDSCTRYGEYHDISVEAFLGIIIDNHNNQTSIDKHFKLGTVNVSANLYRFLAYEKTFDAIKGNLLDRLGGELQVRVESGVRYLDYLTQRGEVQSTEIRLSKNLISIEKELDPSKVITRLAPFGAKKEDSEERLSIKYINNGLDYIDDIEAIKRFGIIENIITWDDVTIAENLLRKAQDKQKEVNRVLKKHKVEAYDLSVLGLDIASFNCCDSYPVINPIMNIDDTLRIVEKNVDINNPQSSSFIIGDKFEDIKNNNIKAGKAIKGVERLSGTINTTIDIMGNVGKDLSDTVEVVNNTVEILSETNKNVNLINSNLINVSTALQDNIRATNELIILTNTITETLNNTTNKISKLQKRVNMGA